MHLIAGRFLLVRPKKFLLKLNEYRSEARTLCCTCKARTSCPPPRVLAETHRRPLTMPFTRAAAREGILEDLIPLRLGDAKR
jgi:hypothetical protein